VKLTLAPDRRSVELDAAASDLDEAARYLRSLEPPVRARRAHGRLQLGFADIERVVDGRPPFDLVLDAEAARALANRAAVAQAADRVHSEARRIQSAPPSEARQLIADSRLADRLDDHQAVNVAVMTLQSGWGTCVFDEQGTGKTATTIAAFDLLVEHGHADVMIVVAPKSMVAEWAVEIRRFCGNLYRVVVADGSPSERARAIDSGADVVVLNYETAASLATNLRLLAQRTRAVLTVDESFFVKNPGTARFEAVAALREWCVRCFVLCGTPAPNRPHDLVAQFDLVDFGHTFAGVTLDDDRDVAAGQVRAFLDARGVYLRSLKRMVLPHLPTRTFSEVGIDMAPRQGDAYRAALDDLILDLRTAVDGTYSRSITSFLERRATLLRICSDPGSVVPGYDELPAKLAALDQVLADLVGERGEKVIVWSFYRASLDRIAERYAHYGLVRIDGSIADVGTRREAVRRFQEDADTTIFLGNPAAAGAGLTLHSARFAVYESLSNQAAHFLQSLDRIHRRGQDREVEYFTLLCRGTLEEVEYERLLEKADRQADLLNDPPQPRPTRTVLLDELLAARERLAATEMRT
jgi:SNF2 family DNA or RNA helicase